MSGNIARVLKSPEKSSFLFSHLSRLQLRLDFLEATLAQPNATGWCDFDVLLVSGGSSTVPRMCGDNTNQHGKLTDTKSTRRSAELTR